MNVNQVCIAEDVIIHNRRIEAVAAENEISTSTVRRYMDKYSDWQREKNSPIRESEMAMECVRSVLSHAGIDFSDMSEDDMIDRSRQISAPCAHDFDRPYRGHGTRKCRKCGGLQTN